jgi:hypothetical protein
VRVSVTDTGPGIAPKDHERIFDEFQQIAAGIEQREGTGLGLALSKRLVELHGGRIAGEHRGARRHRAAAQQQTRLLGTCRRRPAVVDDGSLVVEPQELDDVADVGVVLDPARRRPLRAGEDRVRRDAALLFQLTPDLFGEPEVGGVVAVQVTDLAGADSEGELAAPPGSRLHARPGGDLVDDLLACGFLGHSASFLGLMAAQAASFS